MQGKDLSEQETQVQAYVGIDVHILPGGEAFRVANTVRGQAQLRRRLQPFAVQLTAIEATGKWHRPVHRLLRAAGYGVAIVNPLRA